MLRHSALAREARGLVRPAACFVVTTATRISINIPCQPSSHVPCLGFNLRRLHQRPGQSILLRLFLPYAILLPSQRRHPYHSSCVRPVVYAVTGRLSTTSKLPAVLLIPHLSSPRYFASPCRPLQSGRPPKDLTSFLKRCSARANGQALALSWAGDLDLVHMFFFVSAIPICFPLSP